MMPTAFPTPAKVVADRDSERSVMIPTTTVAISVATAVGIGIVGLGRRLAIYQCEELVGGRIRRANVDREVVPSSAEANRVLFASQKVTDDDFIAGQQDFAIKGEDRIVGCDYVPSNDLDRNSSCKISLRRDCHALGSRNRALLARLPLGIFVGLRVTDIDLAL